MRYNAAVGEEHVLEASEADKGTRLDVFLSRKMSDCSRSFVKRLIDDALVTVGQGGAKPSLKLKGHETIRLFLPELVEMSAEPEDIPLSVLYEDESMIVINKQAGLVVHPAPGHENGTLVNALLHHCSDLSGIGGVLRPGIVHRLDRDTTGVMVCAKSDHAHQELSAQFAARTTRKQYVAITCGVPVPPEGKVEAQIGRHPTNRQRQALLQTGGRYSLTYYKTIQAWDNYALVQCDIRTGRTHQIRVHLKSVHAPILCDADYGTKASRKASEITGPDGDRLIDRQALHAEELTLTHPDSGEEMTFRAPIPADMSAVVAHLGNTT